jgi:two-component system nitrogen regulation response regulator NtrX
MNQVHKIARRLLIVDDEPTICAALARVLRLEGYDVRTAGSCLEAKELLLNQPVDLLLLDINLEDENGWESYRRLIDFGPEHRVLVITARPDQAQGALVAGVKLMQKPLDLPLLLKTVAQLLTEVALSGIEPVERHVALVERM